MSSLDQTMLALQHTVWPVGSEVKGHGSYHYSELWLSGRHAHSQGESGRSWPLGTTHKVPFMGKRRAGHWQFQPQGNPGWG